MDTDTSNIKHIVAVGRYIPGDPEVIIVCDPLFTDTWWEGILRADNDARADQPDAHQVGHDDAISGKPCRAGQWERATDQYAYLIGFREASNMLDYEDSMIDVEWLRGGC